MARCITLTPTQTQQWDDGGWLSLEIEDDIIDYVTAQRMFEPIIVMTSDHRIAFALTPEGQRA